MSDSEDRKPPPLPDWQERLKHENEFYMVDTIEIKLTRNFNNRLITTLKNSYEEKTFMDFTVVTADGAKIPCHRIVLMSSSEVLMELLELDPERTELLIDFFPSAVVKSLIEYCYTDEIKIKGDVLQEAIIAAKFFQMNEVVNWLSNHLGYSYLDDETFSRRRMSEEYNFPGPALSIKNKIVQRFDQVVAELGFIAQDAVEIGKFLKEMGMDDVTPDGLMSSALRWIGAADNDEGSSVNDEQMRILVEKIKQRWDEEYGEQECFHARKCPTFSRKYDMHCYNYNPRQSNWRPRSPRGEQIKKITEQAKRKAKAILEGETENLLVLFDSRLYEDFKAAVKASGNTDEEATSIEKYKTFMMSSQLRSALAVDVIRCANMDKCSIKYLQQMVSNPDPEFSDVFDRIPELKSVFSKGVYSNQLAYQERTKWQTQTNQRLVICGGYNNFREGSVSDDCIVTYDCENFHHYGSLPQWYHPYSASACQVPGGFMLVRGSHATMYNSLTKTYQDLPDPPCHCRRASLVRFEQRVFCFAAKGDDGKEFDEVLTFDLNTRTWGDAPHPGYSFKTPWGCSLGSSIYVIHNHNQFSRLDVSEMKWYEMPKLTKDTSDGSNNIVTDGRLLYALSDGTTLLAFSPEEDKWEWKSLPRKTHFHGTLAYFNDTIFLFGGITDQVEEYNIEKNEWTPSTLRCPTQLAKPFVIRMEVNVPRKEDRGEPLN